LSGHFYILGSYDSQAIGEELCKIHVPMWRPKFPRLAGAETSHNGLALYALEIAHVVETKKGKRQRPWNGSHVVVDTRSA
jgi:hypothetical protein